MSLLKFIAKHEPRTVVFININGDEFIGLLQILHQEQIIDHSIEYKCNYLVNTWELIEVFNGTKPEYIYYHGFIGNEFHFKSGIIHRPSEIYNCVKCETICDLNVGYDETYNFDTNEVPGSWEFEDGWKFVLEGEDINNDDVQEIIDGLCESECSSQYSLEEQDICNCFCKSRAK